MNNYKEKCLALDKELAELLWPMQMQDVRDGKDNIVGRTGIWHPVRDDPKRPRWTQDDNSAFGLMVEHDCYPCKWDDESIACSGECPVLDIKSFPSVYACVRYAIVQAVINKLKG